MGDWRGRDGVVIDLNEPSQVSLDTLASPSQAALPRALRSTTGSAVSSFPGRGKDDDAQRQARVRARAIEVLI